MGDKSKICDKIFSVMTLYVCSSAEVLETQYGEILSMLLSLLAFSILMKYLPARFQVEISFNCK